MILGIDHVGLAVRDSGTAVERFATLTGHPATPASDVLEQAVRVCFVPAEAQTRLELLAPLEAGSALDRFLERRGEGMHHVCFLVDDIHAELDRLRRLEFALIDQTPRRGHGGLVAFVHPRSAHGVLVELLQRDEAPGKLPHPHRSQPQVEPQNQPATLHPSTGQPAHGHSTNKQPTHRQATHGQSASGQPAETHASA